jgi:hypothetical protein
MTLSGPSPHRFLRFFLPARAFQAVETATRQWLAECPCGHKRDLWDAGGVRYGGAGRPRQLALCPQCGKRTWHVIRKKTEREAHSS